MKTNDSLSEQTKQIQISSVISLVLLFVSFSGLFYNLYAFHEMKAKTQIFEAIRTGILLVNIIKLLLFVSFTILFFSAFRYNLKFKFLGLLTTILGIVSFLWILFSFAGLQDISHEYLTGRSACALEWKVLYLGVLVNFIFYLVGFITILKIRQEAKLLVDNRKSITEESTFELTQYLGIVCSTIGIALVLYFYSVFNNNNLIISSFSIFLIIISCLIISLPYVFMVYYWIEKMANEKDGSVFDEKQKHDLLKSGLVAFLFSVIFIFVFFLINHGRIGHISAIAYFPLYLFATLLVFSISVLYHFRKA